MQRQQEWNKFKKILCIRPDNIGDVIMTAPAIRALKHAVPGRKISLLTSSSGAAISRFIPEIEEIILFDTPWVKNSSENNGSQIQRIVDELAARKFDAAIIFTVYSQNPLPSAMICFMAGIPRIAGYCRENPYQLITDWIPDKEPLLEIKHEVERQLELVSYLGAECEDDKLFLKLSKASEGKTLKDLRAKGLLPSGSYIVIHPGVSEEKRKFPIEKFGEAANMLTEDLKVPVVITGSSNEKHLADYIVKVSGGSAVSLAGELSLEDLIAVIKNASVLISNNTGPVHIAAAVQTPVVVLYALTNPQHTPWKVKNKIFPFEISENMRSKNVVIDYAYHKSFRKKPKEVFPEDIVKAAKELMKGANAKQASKVLCF